MQVGLHVLDRLNCDAFYDFFDENSQICGGASSSQKQDTCRVEISSKYKNLNVYFYSLINYLKGDSGGPMMIPRARFPNQYLQIGIVSFGPSSLECQGENFK